MLGQHHIADCYGCTADLNDTDVLKRWAGEAAQKAHVEPLYSRTHRFKPQGATVLVLIAESHLAIHTWPELLYCGIDFFACGQRADPAAGLQYLEERLDPATVERHSRPRAEPLNPTTQLISAHQKSCRYCNSPLTFNPQLPSTAAVLHRKCVICRIAYVSYLKKPL